MEGAFRERCQHGECNTQLTQKNRRNTSNLSIIRAAGLGGLRYDGRLTETVSLCARHYLEAFKRAEAEEAAAKAPAMSEHLTATATAFLEADAPAQQQQQQPPPVGGSGGGNGAGADAQPPPARPTTWPRPVPSAPQKLQSVQRAASASSGKRYDLMVRRMKPAELVDMLKQTAMQLKAAQRSKRKLLAAMGRRSGIHRIQQRSQRGQIRRLKKGLSKAEAALASMTEVRILGWCMPR